METLFRSTLMAMAAVSGQVIAQEKHELLSLLGREETTGYAAASFNPSQVFTFIHLGLHLLEGSETSQGSACCPLFLVVV